MKHFAFYTLLLPSLLLSSSPQEDNYKQLNGRLTRIEQQIQEYTDAGYYGNPPGISPRGFGIFAVGELLYWEALESNLEYVLEQTSPFTGVQTPLEAKVGEVDFKYKPAFRIGLGYHMLHNSWQFAAYWTRYHHSFSDHQSLFLQGNPALLALWTHPQEVSGGPFNLTWGFSDLSWTVNFDAIDCTFSRLSHTQSKLTFQPFIGIKTAFIHQRFGVNYRQSSNMAAFTQYDVNVKNDFWGIGPKVGLEGEWIMGAGFSLFGLTSTAALYSHFDVKRKDIPTPTDFLSIRIKEKTTRVKPMVQALLGLRFQRRLTKSQNSLSLSAGYEGQFWWDQNQMRQFVDKTAITFTAKSQGNLIFQGLTLQGRFDF